MLVYNSHNLNKTLLRKFNQNRRKLLCIISKTWLKFSNLQKKSLPDYFAPERHSKTNNKRLYPNTICSKQPFEMKQYILYASITYYSNLTNGLNKGFSKKFPSKNQEVALSHESFPLVYPRLSSRNQDNSVSCLSSSSYHSITLSESEQQKTDWA